MLAWIRLGYVQLRWIRFSAVRLDSVTFGASLKTYKGRLKFSKDLFPRYRIQFG